MILDHDEYNHDGDDDHDEYNDDGDDVGS